MHHPDNTDVRTNQGSAKIIKTDKIPGACTTCVGALVAGKLVDEHALISVLVERAATACSRRARSVIGAVTLGSILQGSALNAGNKSGAILYTYQSAETNLVIPSAGPVGVRALVARVDVDQNARIAVVVGGTLAVASATVAGERNGLAG